MLPGPPRDLCALPVPHGRLLPAWRERPMTDPARRLTSEFLGTALLLAVVVGSGIMGERLAGGNAALALLGNTLATGAVLIGIFGPLSGAHFNPVVTFAFRLRGEIGTGLALAYVALQIIGAVLGVWTAHLMFGMPVLEVSTKLRGGAALGFSEFVATFGLLGTIFGLVRFRPDSVPVGVGLYITSAYWFTASTSFANPAVTLARSLTDSFAGIAPRSAPQFIAAQLAGGLVATLFFGWLFRQDRPDDRVPDHDLS